MKALILRQNAESACAISKVLIDKGFQILCVETLAVAHARIRVDTIDLLVMDERFDNQLTHSIALSGERRSPYIATIMLTDRDRAETDDLYELIQCLYALDGMTISPHILGQLALAAVSNIEEAISRVQERALLLTDLVDADIAEEEAALAGDPCYADIAIAAPAFEELLSAQTEKPQVIDRPVVAPEVALTMQANPFLRHTPRVPQMAGSPA